jgi:hypothetical protein
MFNYSWLNLRVWEFLAGLQILGITAESLDYSEKEGGIAKEF